MKTQTIASIVVAVLVVLVLGAIWYTSGPNSAFRNSVSTPPSLISPEPISPSLPSPTIESTPSVSPTPVTSISQDLTEQNLSGLSGSVAVRQSGSRSVVNLSVDGATATYTAKIFSGNCSDLGSAKYPLNSVVNGSSVTTLNVSFATLRAAGPLAVAVYSSPNDSQSLVACSDLLF